jgi:hypothetical protein
MCTLAPCTFEALNLAAFLGNKVVAIGRSCTDIHGDFSIISLAALNGRLQTMIRLKKKVVCALSYMNANASDKGVRFTVEPLY